MATSLYKKCFVPGCGNTSAKTPHKIFLSLPSNMGVRRRWCEALNIKEVPTTRRHCCEDHFNLEEDAENWQYFKTIGQRIKIRTDAVPRIVTPTKRKPTTQISSSTKKRKEDTLKHMRVAAEPQPEPVAGPSTMCQMQPVPQCSHMPDMAQEKPLSRRVLFPAVTSKGEEQVYTPREHQSVAIEADVLAAPLTPTKQYMTDVATSPSGVFRKSSKGIQFNHRPSVRSVGVNVKLGKIAVSTFTPTPGTSKGLRSECEEMQSETSETFSDEYQPSSKTSDTSATSESLETHSNRCKSYLGLPKDAYFLVKFCCEEKNLKELDVLLTLKKIKTNDQYARLADDFCISASYAGKIFTRTVPILAAMMKQLIYWPTSDEIRKSLPIAFRSKYYEVKTIIDCFEVAIEKPSNPTHQALTWSDYYQANTIKFMVSSTPNGIINFVTCGFGGRTSDKIIVEESGFLDVLPNNYCIMADRGFKHIGNALSKKGCTLLRPPSVEGNQPLSKLEVKVGKQIAALRIHIERVIGRIREFHMLLPYAHVDHNLIYLLDYIVLIACGVVNVQHSLIK